MIVVTLKLTPTSQIEVQTLPLSMWRVGWDCVIYVEITDNPERGAVLEKLPTLDC